MNYAIITIPELSFITAERASNNSYWMRVQLSSYEGIITALETVIDHYPTQEDFDLLYLTHLTKLKKNKIAEVERYDKSEQVNGLYLAGQHCWLDKATRVGLANSIAIEKAAGKTETTLYLNGIALTIGIEQAQQMLSALELYALDCYRKTEEHKATINALSIIEEVEKYDVTQGYPEKL